MNLKDKYKFYDRAEVIDLKSSPYTNLLSYTWVENPWTVFITPDEAFKKHKDTGEIVELDRDAVIGEIFLR